MSEFKLPDIGEGIVECEVVKWLVGEGDTIDEDQPVVEVMTDKALVEITAPEAGRVTRLHYTEGESARVHTALFSYRARQDDSADGSEHVETKTDTPVDEGSTSNEVERHATPSGSLSACGVAPGVKRVPASPAVRRLVRELGVALADIPGSGKDGRVLKEDVLAWQQEGRDTPTVSHGAALVKPSPDRREPLRGMRAAMARHMAESASRIPHFHYGEEIDVSELLALYESLKPQSEAQGQRLTLMALFMKSLALAVQDHPLLNVTFDEEANEIVHHDHCNIGMAVDGQAGLIVPTVKHVERLTVLEVAGEVARLTQAAREGRVDQADLKGGTISVSNIGALGGTYAAPIISAPQVAIVALGRVQWLPRFDASGQVVSRAIMTVTWAGDHRVLDGGSMARFCNCWKAYLEAPQSMLLRLG